jgi:hypothetical protein
MNLQPFTPPMDSSAEEHAEVLALSLNAENLIFSYFAIMKAVHRREVQGDPPTLAGIAIATGQSYHAVRHVTERTHYLERVEGTPIGLRLTQDGREKLARISRRLARYAAEAPSASAQ